MFVKNKFSESGFAHYVNGTLGKIIGQLSNGVLQLLNHNTPLDWWRTDIQEFELDDMEIR